MLHHPAGDADAERALVGEDQVGEPVAGDDRATHAGLAVDAVDGQRVVRDDDLQRVGDEVEDARRLEVREEPLVDLEESALARELMLELDLLEPDPLHQADVLHRDRDVVAERPRQVGLVGRPRVFGAVIEHEQAEHLVAEEDRHVAHRPHAIGAVHPAQVGDRAAEVAGHHADPPLAKGGHPDGLRAPEAVRRRPSSISLRESALGREMERRRAVLVGPQTGPIDAEQVERGVDDLFEETAEVLEAADLGDDPPQRVRARRRIGGRRRVGRPRPGRAGRRSAPGRGPSVGAIPPIIRASGSGHGGHGAAPDATVRAARRSGDSPSVPAWSVRCGPVRSSTRRRAVGSASPTRSATDARTSSASGARSSCVPTPVRTP